MECSLKYDDITGGRREEGGLKLIYDQQFNNQFRRTNKIEKQAGAELCQSQLS